MHYIRERAPKPKPIEPKPRTESGLLLVRIREPACPAAQHLHALVHGHVDLLAHRDETFGQVQVVLAHQVHGDEDVVDVSEDEGFFLGVAVFLLDEGLGVVAPVPAGV